MTGFREYGHIRSFDVESEDSVSPILTTVEHPRDLPRLNMTLEAFEALPDMTFKSSFEPSTMHKRQLRCGTWIIEQNGQKCSMSFMLITSYRACIRVKAVARPRLA